MRQSSRTWASVLGVVVLLGAVFASCGDGNDNTANDPTATSVPPATDFPTPTVEDGTYRFDDKGYAVEEPEGWTASPNYVFEPAGSRFPSDAFLFPEVDQEIQPSIVVTCLRPRDDQPTLEAFSEAWRGLLTNLEVENLSVDDISVASSPAQEISYTQALRRQTGEDVFSRVEKTDVIFMSDGCRWLITMTTSEGTHANHRDALESLVESFELL